LGDILLKTVETTAIVMLLIGASSAMSWILSYENIPQGVSEALIGLTDSKLIILLLINILLLVVGTFMDMTPAVLIFTPIFLPVVTVMGVTPLHFGIMMILNLCIGLTTPPRWHRVVCGMRDREDQHRAIVTGTLALLCGHDRCSPAGDLCSLVQSGSAKTLRLCIEHELNIIRELSRILNLPSRWHN
jgi:hypothetical protein